MALPDPGAPSPGEIGGIAAGAVALLATFGAGIRWLLGWKERREESRAAKLEAWHRELKEWEKQLHAKNAAFEARLEARLEELSRENRALRVAFQLVSAPLRQLDPTNPNLAQAERVLAAAFPTDPNIPADIAELLSKLGDGPQP